MGYNSGIHDYEQVGEMHINGNTNVRAFTEGTGNTRQFYNIPSGNEHYWVFYHTGLNGNCWEFSWNEESTSACGATGFYPNYIENAGEIVAYQDNSYYGVTSYGDAAMGDKTHHVYSNSVAWLDTGSGSHAANLSWHNNSTYGHGSGGTADYQTFANTNSNNWSTWDNRCG